MVGQVGGAPGAICNRVLKSKSSDMWKHKAPRNPMGKEKKSNLGLWFSAAVIESLASSHQKVWRL